jgi:hypothetical protein
MTISVVISGKLASEQKSIFYGEWKAAPRNDDRLYFAMDFDDIKLLVKECLKIISTNKDLFEIFIDIGVFIDVNQHMKSFKFNSNDLHAFSYLNFDIGVTTYLTEN